MKKTLLTATLIAALSTTTLTANAFCWRNLNPANWNTCPKCERQVSCGCQKDRCSSCTKKENPCKKKNSCCQTQKPQCNCGSNNMSPCDRLQQETERN